jgi:hypothetical protein
MIFGCVLKLPLDDRIHHLGLSVRAESRTGPGRHRPGAGGASDGALSTRCFFLILIQFFPYKNGQKFKKINFSLNKKK